ncbi:vacuolar cation/proton exchanger 1a-like [Phalaenopsis equestris]|uniref:vacuolar cation/proton exchanger 1a-like n=1 Tax=Phalaenopsis equestris TaxID=78828 RepID=UPI0009E2CEFB|nr:vacuolar cation/proton exchanger 1a-like [Phalaenopsis equestris]
MCIPMPPAPMDIFTITALLSPAPDEACVAFPAVPLAIATRYFGFGHMRGFIPIPGWEQTDANTSLLLLGALCNLLPLMFRLAVNYGEHYISTVPTLELLRVWSIVMLAVYIAFSFFQRKSHWQFFEYESCLLGATIVIAVLSEFIVGTIEDASESWRPSMRFISIVLLSTVGNAAEHAGAVTFAVKNKLDISLGVSLGSATQISMFVVPSSVIVSWMMGVPTNLDFKILETASLVFSIVITGFALQDGTSHYLQGLAFLLAYIIIGACFFVLSSPDGRTGLNVNVAD